MVKMKEFYIDNIYSIYDGNPIENKRKIRIHLCDECYKRLLANYCQKKEEEAK